MNKKTNNWPLVSLGKVLVPVTRPERVDPAETYRILGAHWYALGLYVKNVASGSEVRARELYRVEKGDFVYNRLFGWKGAFAIATDANDGCYVSNEFPCFQVRRGLADGQYIWKYFSRSSVWDEVLSLSTGGTPTSRNRLKENELLAMTIPLPPPGDQQRIVARIEELAITIDQARGLRRQAATETEVLASSQAKLLLHETEKKYGIQPLLDICDFEGGSQPPKSMFRYEPASGYVRFLQIRDFSSDDHLTFLPESPRNSLVRKHEVLVGRYGASLGKILRGKEGAYNVAMCKAVPLREELSHDFLAYSLAHGQFQDRLSEISRSAQAGFNKADLSDVQIAVPPLAEQRRIVAYLDDLQRKADGLKALQEETSAELDALMPSILDKAFRGEL